MGGPRRLLARPVGDGRPDLADQLLMDEPAGFLDAGVFAKDSSSKGIKHRVQKLGPLDQPYLATCNLQIRNNIACLPILTVISGQEGQRK
jgi:hypothetical protein